MLGAAAALGAAVAWRPLAAAPPPPTAAPAPAVGAAPPVQPAAAPAASSSAATAPSAGADRASAAKLPPMPAGLRANFECALRCTQMTDGDRAAVEAALRQAGCDPENPGSHVVCATTPEQVCVGACGGGQQDMTKWLPGAFGPGAPSIAGRLPELDAVHADYWRCAERCSLDGVVVDAGSVDAEAQALEVLRRCGVVQLAGGFDEELLGCVQRGIDALSAKKKAYDKLVDHQQLHDGRYQVYLPFAEPFKSRAALGANDLVVGVLAEYFTGLGFGIDHVSVLTSASPSGNQSLHPDVPYFKGLTVSIHTALLDVTREMGPTYFCPCTGEALQPEEWPASAAIKMTILKDKACFGPSFAPAFTRKGTITIYDGAMFHQGLENLSGKDRPVLKLEVGAKGFPARRNYIQLAPPAGKKQTRLFREALGPPRMGDPLPEE